MIKVGDKVTLSRDIVNEETGEILMEMGDEREVRELVVEKAHYHTLYAEKWIEERINGIKLEGIYGIWSLKYFEELNVEV